MEYRWLEVVLRRFNSSVSYYTDCTDSVRGGAELDSQALDSHDRRVSREAKHAMIPF